MYSDVIRKTWLPYLPSTVDLRFFRGRGAVRKPLEDEVFLDCRDDYEGLPNKVQEIIRWAHEHGYDYVLKCDDDVVLKPRQLMESGFDKHNFVGCQEPACKPGEIKTPYGFCYWLSRGSMELVLAAPLPAHGNDEAWVSTVLHTNNVFLKHDSRYYLHRGARPRTVARTARAPKRDNPPQMPSPPIEAFAYCVYLNWSGFHMTPDSVNLNEIRWLYETYAKGLNEQSRT